MSTRGQTFAGIGDLKTTTLGSMMFPVAIELVGGDDVTERALEGELESTELKEGNSHLLLSLHAQALMGLVKDMEAGTIYAKHSKRYVKCYQDKRTELRCICISDFDETPIKRHIDAGLTIEKDVPMKAEVDET